MIINSDVNILGGLSDFNLIRVFLDKTNLYEGVSGRHRAHTSITTEKAVKRFEKAIKGTMLHFDNDAVRYIITNCIQSEGISNDSLYLLFLNASKNNDLLNYLNESVFFPALYCGRIGIKTEEVIACLYDLKGKEPGIQKWSDTTIKTTASKYLTLLKKFNLLEGTISKSIIHTFLNDKTFVLFIYWLVAVEGSSNLINSSWLKYFFLEQNLFIDRILLKKYSKYYHLNYNGEHLRIEPVLPYQHIYNELTKS